VSKFSVHADAATNRRFTREHIPGGFERALHWIGSKLNAHPRGIRRAGKA